MESLYYRPNVTIQVLLDYAISSYMMDNMTCSITNEELNQYATDREAN